MTARSRAIAKEIQEQAVTQAAIERAQAIRDIIAAIEHLGDVGANLLCHLSYRQAGKYAKAAMLLAELGDELEAGQ